MKTLIQGIIKPPSAIGQPLKPLGLFLGVLTLLVMTLAACGDDGASASPPTASTEQVNLASFEAVAAKNLAKFADILADDFVFTQVPGPGGTEQLTVTGKSAFMVRLAGQMENNTIITDSEAVVDGDKASGKYSITADNLRAIGVDGLTGTYEATTRDGKLASLATVIDGPSLQKLGAALAPPSTEQTNLAYFEALTAKDLAKFADILTDDFVFTQVPGPGGTEQLTVTGKSAFMVRLAGQMENNTIITDSEAVVDGDTARGKYSITADNLRAIGVDALTGTYEATTRDGKLASLATVIDGPSLQKLGAALAALAQQTN